MAKPQTAQSSQPKLKPTSHPWQWIPWVIIAGVFIVIALDQLGYIHLSHFGDSGFYEMHPPAIIGTPYSYNFYNDLVPLLGPESDPATYTFYLGSGVGFPPQGLILGPNGILSGTPTGKSSTFQACVKDVGGHSACRTYHLTVNPNNGNNETPKNETPVYNCSHKCPATSAQTDTPCNSVHQEGEFNAKTEGVIVYDCCDCPNDTYYSGTTDRVTPGGPYKICNCY